MNYFRQMIRNVSERISYKVALRIIRVFCFTYRLTIFWCACNYTTFIQLFHSLILQVKLLNETAINYSSKQCEDEYFGQLFKYKYKYFALKVFKYKYKYFVFRSI